MHLLYKNVFIKMTTHFNKKTLQNFEEWYTEGKRQKKGIKMVFVNKKNKLRYMKWYKCESVYEWYKKVIKKTVLKIDGIQNAIQFFRYMSGIQTKKSRIKSYTDLFLLL